MEDDQLEDLARRLHDEHGILIPTQPSSEFTLRTDNRPNSTPAPQSLIRLERAINDRVPYAGKLAKIIVFYSSLEWSYPGRTWPQNIGGTTKTRDYDEMPLMIAEDQYYITARGKELVDDDLPVAGSPYPFVRTAMDYFSYGFFHELGHGIDLEILFRKYDNVEQYVKEAENADAIKDNPIYATFGELTGWRFGRGVVAQRMMITFNVDVGDKWLNPVKEEANGGDFVQHPDEGSVRRLLFTRHPLTNSISEVFADFFVAYLMAPEVLTADENRYFGRLHKGLKCSPEQFMREIARNPQMLLK